MTAPIRLTYAEVVEAGRKAYLEGRLSAQGPTPECRYRDSSGHPCVIGAALTDKQALYLDRNYDAQVHKLPVEVLDCGIDLRAIRRIQQAHDEWASPETRRSGKLAHTRLRKLLNIEEPA